MNDNRVTNILVLILIFLISISIFIQLKQQDIIDVKIKSSIDSLKKEKYTAKDGYTPQKGIDYFDGKDGIDARNGRDGRDSISVNTIEKETIVKEIAVNGNNGNNGRDGITPYIRCNSSKNRWEVSYNNMESYQVIKDTDDNPVRCIIQP